MPRVRRLRDPVRGPGVHAGARHRAAQDGVRVRDRLQRPVHVLHGHVRDARDPRACARPRDRDRGRSPELSVWVVTGDGDGLSIGGNHLIHALRRNVDIKILLFNNQIYGLTKGQYSPTSEEGKVTKSTPFGSVDHPFNPIALALGAEATFVARTIDNDRQHLTEVLRRAAQHKGTAFVEIYQNCNVFNDGAFDLLRDKTQGKHNQIRLEHGEPIVFDEGTRAACASARTAGTRSRPTAETDPDTIVVHDAHGRPSLAFALAHLSQGPDEPSCIGVFHEVERPVYGQAIQHQLQAATERLGAGDLGSLSTPATPGRSSRPPAARRRGRIAASGAGTG